MIGSWRLQHQSSVRVVLLISKRVQNRCIVQCNSFQCCQRSASSIASSSSSTQSASNNAKLYNSRSTNRISGSNSHQDHHRRHHQYRSYGTQLKVHLDPFPEEVIATSNIEPYLRTCLRKSVDTNTTTTTDNNEQRTMTNDKYKAIDMEFVITFLGTGGGSPTMHRNGSCTALRLGGQTYLFDVCEGTYRQLQFTRISPMSISKIFISHLHGDHLFGLVPVIMGIMVAHKVARMIDPPPQVIKKGTKGRKFNNNNKIMSSSIAADAAAGEDSSVSMMKKPTLEIYGPPGLYNYIGMVLSLSCSKLNYLNVKVIELVGGKEERGFGGGGSSSSSSSSQRGRRNVFTSHYPEIQAPLVTRKLLEPNDDMTWTIDAPPPVTADSPQTSASNDGFTRLPNDTNLGSERRLHIKAAELDHISGVQTFGYVVEEQPPPGTIDKEKAMALGVMPSKKYGLLKCGISVPTDDGTGEVHPSQVLCNVFRPRKFSLLADHRLVPPPMSKLCSNSDIIVHEATLSRKDGIHRIKARGHQNAFNAGVFAKMSGCKVLALNHFGGTAFGESLMTGILAEARDGNENASEIIASYDFMEIYVPRGGFSF